METISQTWESMVAPVARKVLSVTMDFNRQPHWDSFFYVWLSQFIMSWVGFSIYMYWDYQNYKKEQLEINKLPTRHPLEPFWYAQLKMVPLVLYNQCVVWPLISILLINPIWERTHGIMADWWWSHWYFLIPVFPILMVISDFMWYTGHRLMHTPYAWEHWHRMHHIAPQSAISATYVHPVEYATFCFCMQLPFACLGIPYYVYVFPEGWGMMTGSGAHSGYSGEFANGDKHNAHHVYHNVNFGLLMIADMVCGTHWEPGDPQPTVWSEGVKIWEEYPEVYYGQSTETGGTQHPDKIKKSKAQEKIFEFIRKAHENSKKTPTTEEKNNGKSVASKQLDGGSSSDDETKASCSDPEVDSKKNK